jgi:glutathione synthase/RimK-type ligase-like ATP-grasp enzyme
MKVRLAAHRAPGFAERWIEGSHPEDVAVSGIDGYRSGIVSELGSFDAVAWQLSQDRSLDLTVGRQVLAAAEMMGLTVFPNHATRCHFDDKIAQKYILEATGAPLAKTWVFFTRDDARAFLRSASFPLVFKLRRGAGSMNVHLLRDRVEGEKVARKAFSGGFRPFPVIDRLSRAGARFASSGPRKVGFGGRARRALRVILEQTFRVPRERGYLLLQEFIPGNVKDTRVTIIGDRRFCFFRGVRDGDFRASGSGRISYPDRDEIPADMIEIAAGISDRLGFQSMAYDFVREPATGRAVLLEMSFTFNAEAVFRCPGYLHRDGSWRTPAPWPQDAILEDLVAATRARFAR